MIKKLALSLIFVTCLISATGCVYVVDAVAQKPIQTDPSKRSFGGYIDDKELKTIIAVNIRKASNELAKQNISVRSFNSVILLTGEVPTKELRELAGTTARKVTRVRQVYNELQIASKRGFWSNQNDKLLASKIKAKLLFNKNIKSSRVKIYVENKTVYIMGLLTHAQVKRVTDIVRRQRGVKKVVRAVEYID